MSTVLQHNLKKRVCITGLGRVGLPMACLLATSGYTVLGVDTDDEVVRSVQAANLIHSEKNLQNLLISALHNKCLEVSKTVSPAEIHIIAVPTLLNSENQPDIAYVNQAIEALKPHLRSKDLILIESTCPIGTTDTIAKALRSICSDLSVAYCPERIFPGNTLYELVHNSRIIGGVDDASTLQAANFYRSFVCGEIITANVRVTEAVKLAENAYRDINIAYANELSMIADRINIDINELIRLANKHPRVNILNPGPGVGGYCIAIDPWFLVPAAPDLTVLIAKAREVNLQKTEWVIQKVREAIKDNNAQVIACLGLTYKPNVSDSSASPALTVAETLEKELEVLRVDPYLPNTQPLYEALVRAEIVVCLVAHREFQNIPLHCLDKKILLDFAGGLT